MWTICFNRVLAIASGKEHQVRIKKIHDTGGELRFELLDGDDRDGPVVAEFLQQLHARGYSPNTLSAYAYDLLHFFHFLAQRGDDYAGFTPPDSLAFLEYLRAVPSRRPTHRLTPVLTTV